MIYMFLKLKIIKTFRYKNMQSEDFLETNNPYVIYGNYSESFKFLPILSLFS